MRVLIHPIYSWINLWSGLGILLCAMVTYYYVRKGSKSKFVYTLIVFSVGFAL